MKGMKRVGQGGNGRRSSVRRLSLSQLRAWGWETVAGAPHLTLGATMLSGGVIVRVGGEDLAVDSVSVPRPGVWRLWGFTMEGLPLRRGEPAQEGQLQLQGRDVPAGRVYFRCSW